MTRLRNWLRKQNPEERDSIKIISIAEARLARTERCVREHQAEAAANRVNALYDAIMHPQERGVCTDE